MKGVNKLEISGCVFSLVHAIAGHRQVDRDFFDHFPETRCLQQFSSIDIQNAIFLYCFVVVISHFLMLRFSFLAVK